MIPDESRLALATSVVATAIEELTFLPIDVVPKDGQGEVCDSCYWGIVTAEGTGVRWLGLIMSAELVDEIAEIVLDPSSQLVADPQVAAVPSVQERLLELVGELANTACGAVVRALDPGMRFTLGLPLTGRGRPPWTDEHTRDQLLVDGKRLDLFLGWQNE